MKTSPRVLLALLPLVALVGCRGAESAGRSADTTDAVQPGTDAEKVQGMWEIVSFEAARPGDGPEPDKLKAIRLVFAADRLTISVGTGWQEQYVFTLDPTKDPRHMTLIEDDGRARGPGTPRVGTVPGGTARKPEGEQSLWIYKFEGDTLVIAVADPGAPRPTDFTPRGIGGGSTAKGTAGKAPAGGRVDIIRLKRTNTPAGGPRYGTAYGTPYGTYRGTYRYPSTYYSTYRGTSFGTYRGTYRGTYPSTFRGTSIGTKK